MARGIKQHRLGLSPAGYRYALRSHSSSVLDASLFLVFRYPCLTMTYPTAFLTKTITLSLLLASTAWAGSVGSAGSAGSSASSAGSASLKGSSTSIEASSGASSGGGNKDKTALVQTGDYRVSAVETATDAPDTLRLTLSPQGIDAAESFVLKVPRQAFAEAPQAGELIHAQRRDYGVQFSRAQTPFFLVLAQAWQSDLDSHPVTP